MDRFRLFNRYDGGLTLSALPVFSAGVVKESGCCYCAHRNLKNKIGMNQGYCGMALYGLVSNWLSVAKDEECIFSVTRMFLPGGTAVRTVVLQEGRCLLACTGGKYDSHLSC